MQHFLDQIVHYRESNDESLRVKAMFKQFVTANIAPTENVNIVVASIMQPTAEYL